jgi:hypothetical protein
MQEASGTSTSRLRPAPTMRRWITWLLVIAFGVILARATGPYFALGIAVILATLLRRPLRWNVNPLTARKLRRFRHLRRGYWSFCVLAGCWFLSLFAELFVNDRALVVRHDGDWYFPTFSRVYYSSDFGVTGAAGYEPVNYRELDARFEQEDTGDFVWMPLVPYGPNENNTFQGVLKYQPPTRLAGISSRVSCTASASRCSSPWRTRSSPT